MGTTVSWKSGVTGNWNSDPEDWSAGAPPNPGDFADIESGRVSITSQIATIASLQIGRDALLAIHAPGEIQSISGSVVNNGNLWVDEPGIGGSTLHIAGTLQNTGPLAIGNTGLTAPTEVTVGGLIESGSILLVGNAGTGSAIQATLAVTGPTPATWTGQIRIAGDADFELQTGITSIAAGAAFELDGAEARASLGVDVANTALKNLSSNAGRFNLGASGAVVTTTGDLANSGNINVDFNGIGGNTLSIGGVLTNTGVLSMGGTQLEFSSEMDVAALANSGAISLVSNSAAVAKLTSANDLDNSGSIRVDGIGTGGSTLTIGGVLTNSGVIVIGNTVAAAGVITAAGLTNTGSMDIDVFGGFSAPVISNYGLIAGFGIYLPAGGTVTNFGTMSGGGNEIYLAGFYGTVTNFGTIAGNEGIFGRNDTIANGGVIAGYGAYAIGLQGFHNRLIAYQGALFEGVVLVAGGTMELAAGPNAQYPGLLPGIGSNFRGFDTLIVDAGAAWEISGGVNGAAVVNDGAIIVSDNIDPTGELVAFGAIGEDAGSHGVIKVGSGGVVNFYTAVDKGQTLRFTDAYGSLLLSDPGEFSAHIAGFQHGDVIDLVGQAVGSFTYRQGSLTLREDGSKVGVLLFSGHYTKQDFRLSADANGGTYITLVNRHHTTQDFHVSADADGGADITPASHAQSGLWSLRG